MYYDRIDGDQYCNSLYDMVRAGRFTQAFDGWQMFTNTNLTIQNNLIISHRAMAFKGVFTVFFQGNDTNNMNPGYQRFFTFLKLGTTQYQYRILGELWPELAVDCLNDSQRNFTDYLEWMAAWIASGEIEYFPPLQLEDFNNDSFMIMGDFSNNPLAWMKDNFITNFSTAKMASDLQLNISFSGAPASGYQARHLINFTYIVTAPPKGQDWDIQF